MMAFTIPNGVTDVIKKLSNFPNRIDRLKATQLKAMFDQAAKNVQEDVKRLVSELGASTAAGNIGFSPTAGVNKTNIQAAIENVQSQIAGVALGSIPDGAITAQQLAGGAVTAEKVAPGAIAFLDVSDQYQISIGLATTGATSSEVLSHEFRFLPALGVVAFNLHLKIETQEKAALYFVAEGPYTPRYNVNGEAVSASVTGSTSGSLGVGVCANITYTESSGKRFMDVLLNVSNAAKCVVVVSGWFFAHEAEVT